MRIDAHDRMTKKKNHYTTKTSATRPPPVARHKAHNDVEKRMHVRLVISFV